MRVHSWQCYILTGYWNKTVDLFFLVKCPGYFSNDTLVTVTYMLLCKYNLWNNPSRRTTHKYIHAWVLCSTEKEVVVLGVVADLVHCSLVSALKHMVWVRRLMGENTCMWAIKITWLLAIYSPAPFCTILFTHRVYFWFSCWCPRSQHCHWWVQWPTETLWAPIFILVTATCLCT